MYFEVLLEHIVTGITFLAPGMRARKGGFKVNVYMTRKASSAYFTPTHRQIMRTEKPTAGNFAFGSAINFMGAVEVVDEILPVFEPVATWAIAVL